MTKFIEKYRTSSKATKIIVRSLVGLFGFIIILGVSAEFTSRPSFCVTCHYMEPFVDSWKTSTHSEVTCVKCHFPPGLAGTIRGKLEGLVQVVNYLGQSYLRRRPWAEITDASCLTSGCHETRLLKGKVNFKGVVFDHDAHLGELRRGKDLRCTSCHSQIVQGDHMVVTETSCFLCHFKKGGEVEPETFQTLSDCQTCHHWETVSKEQMAQYRFDHTEVMNKKIDCTRCHNQTIVGDGFVPQENCYSCHFDRERLSQYGNSTLLHKVHIADHKIECIQCHLRIQHKVQKLAVDSEVECATCHTDTHKEQLLLFTGKEFNGVTGMPNPMFESGLNCASCHMFHENLIGEADVKIAKPESCESCHGKGYARLLNLWEQSADKKLLELNRVVNNVSDKLRGYKGSNSDAVSRNIDKAEYGMHIVMAGKAIHNITYSDKIISKSYEYLEEALRLANMEYAMPEFVSAPVVPSECANCHTGVESISTRFENREFSHEVHLVEQKLKCNTCHSNARTHGELVLNKETCNSCHHRTATVDNCSVCHESANSIYSGTLVEETTPDIMHEAGVECADCHYQEDSVNRPDAKICLDCHESGYDEMAVEWKNSATESFKTVRDLIDSLKSRSGFTATREFEQIVNRIDALERESAHGIHNFELTSEILLDAESRLKEMF